MTIDEIIKDKSDESVGIEVRLNRILEILYDRRFVNPDKSELNAQNLCNELSILGKQLEHGEVEELFDILSDDKYVLLNRAW